MCDGDLAVYRMAFKRLDRDGNGTLSGTELANVFRQFGHNPSDQELTQIIREVDKDNSGTIDFEEFCELAKRYKYILVNEGNLKATFAQMDKNGDGSLSKEEFRMALRELGKDLSDKELEVVLSKIDVNGDGEITYEEFEQHWLNHHH